MTKNLYEFGQFQGKRNIIALNENVQAVDDLYRVRKRIDVPMSLVNAFKKKVKDESGKNISQFYSDVELAEEIAEYIITSYVSIENLPVNLILGDQYSKAQGGAQAQGQMDTEDLDETQPVQGQAQMGAQPGAQGQAQMGAQPQPGAQPGMQAQMPAPPAQGAQRTAAAIPPMQGGQAI
jgi:hypothetical protein